MLAVNSVSDLFLKMINDLHKFFFCAEYICHVYVRRDGLAGVVIGDHEYQQRVAHTLINKVLETFSPFSTLKCLCLLLVFCNTSFSSFSL